MKAKTHEIAEVAPRREIGLLDEMDRVFDSVFHRGWLHPFRDLWPEWARLEEGLELRTPRIDVLNLEEEMVVRVELPGVKREDLTVELAGDLLTIRGEQRHETKVEKGALVRSEIGAATFTRSLALPTGLDTAKGKAELKDGILEVHLPRLEKAQRTRIEIA
jgi:HSP20 family protein